MMTFMTVSGDDTADQTVASIDKFALNELLPSDKEKYFRYNGSLTTAACYQTVIWTVFKEPVTISAYQVITANINETHGLITITLID